MITLLLLARATYMYGVVLHAHPVRGESHNQRNTTGEVATLPCRITGSSTTYSLQPVNGMAGYLFRRDVTCELRQHA